MGGGSSQIITLVIVVGAVLGAFALYRKGYFNSIFASLKGLGSGGSGYSGAASAGGTGGCSTTAFVDKGNSPGWYTAGANSAGGAGWGGKAGHHHCDWKSPCCFCTDVKKCISSGTPPFAAGQCRPDWGTSGYLGGGSYPANADFSACPAGTR